MIDDQKTVYKKPKYKHANNYKITYGLKQLRISPNGLIVKTQAYILEQYLTISGIKRFISGYQFNMLNVN